MRPPTPAPFLAAHAHLVYCDFDYHAEYPSYQLAACAAQQLSAKRVHARVVVKGIARAGAHTGWRVVKEWKAGRVVEGGAGAGA